MEEIIFYNLLIIWSNYDNGVNVSEYFEISISILNIYTYVPLVRVCWKSNIFKRWEKDQ
jgi:hypothetical protein